MLNPDYIPPKTRIAETETKKRIRIIEDILPELEKYSSAILLTGSMAYGQDFSVTPISDIDIQLLTTPEKIAKIWSCKFFQKYNTEKIIQGFSEGIFGQWNISFIVRNITVECHFWDEKTYKEILRYEKESVVRLRSQTKKISTDYAHSFDGEEDIAEYPDYKSGQFNVGIFPAYRLKKGKIFLCRPIANILGNSIKLFDECDIKWAIRECKNITKQKLADMPREEWKTYSIFNTLPGKNKVSDEVKWMVEDVTID